MASRRTRKPNSKSIPTRTRVVKRIRRRSPQSSPMMMGLRSNSGYASLLTNPCTGPLVHAPGSSEGGQVVRFETDFLISTGIADTTGFLNFSPGAFNGANGTTFATGTKYPGTGMLVGATTTDLTTITPALAGGNLLPGFGFLTTNASSYRCIAACVQLYFPGSELNRQGIVAAAHGTYGLLNTTDATTTSQLRSICPVVERTPNDHLEVRWVPNYADGLFRNPTSSQIPEDGHSSILMTWAGLPAATGVRIRIVSVYEWRPKTTGLVLSSNTATSAPGLIQDVRNTLDRLDPHWWYSLGSTAATTLSGMTIAYNAFRGSSYPRAGRQPAGQRHMELR